MVIGKAGLKSASLMGIFYRDGEQLLLIWMPVDVVNFRFFTTCKQAPCTFSAYLVSINWIYKQPKSHLRVSDCATAMTIANIVYAVATASLQVGLNTFILN